MERNDAFTGNVTPDPIDVGAVISSVAMAECGGIGVFVGTVRRSASVSLNKDKPVVRLEYEAHPTLAVERLNDILDEAAAKWDLRRAVVIHRVGACDVGEPTVVVACCAPHRADALDACRYVIDTVKSTVPIWKREIYSDGSEWVGAEGDAH
ncbi:MAG: molybdenum cofactor biosynthesis protein MoaE [Actinomycetota bacterium]|nr:molybdenum cofactor biosynthesis protein MoaE [Actinomycetota bacterium]